MLLVPSARWAEADEALAGLEEQSPTMTLVYLGITGGQALRRGDIAAANQLLENLKPMAIASGEPQRIIPMAAVVLPWLMVTGDLAGLRTSTEEILTALDGQWPPVVLDSVPVVRALAVAGELELLERTLEMMRTAPKVTALLEIALGAGDGLLALARGRADDAVEKLGLATAREWDLGRTYDAACLELDLARALEASGDASAAEEARVRAVSILEPLGCVNPF